jgi:hypothetical protein
MAGNRDFQGAAGSVYRYLHVEQEQMTPLGAGNFLYVRVGAGAPPTVIYAGEAERLTTGLGERWQEAVELHGATHVYVRRNVMIRTRQDEMADLIAAYVPIMNGQPNA